MRLVVDASTLVAELLRETRKRLEVRVSRGLPERVATRYWDAAMLLKEEKISEVPEEVYVDLKEEALRRVPRDPKDWPVAALALFLGADILTADADFFGCGIATWTVDTLMVQLERRDASPFL